MLLDEATTIITEEIQALRRLVDHFSQFAKLPEPQLQIADLTQVCQQVFELEATAFPQHRFQWQGPSEPWMLAFDPQLIRQLILNLVKNAAEASENRPATIILRMERIVSPPQVKVEVEDDGPGIPASDLDRIWEAYFTSKHTGPHPGMGLGLAISRKIAIDHNGELSVRSQAGQTIFQLLLPDEPTHSPR
jgi:nitrogen fixation/metabolism regulation signal transduction histidine kinase